MKILYAVQGTGNGHACRAGEFIPLFRKQGRVDVLLSGNCVDVKMGQPVDYHLDGISYTFGKTGGIDIPKTLLKLSLRRFFQDVRDFPIQRYDLVINDFEPVTAWAARRAGIPCVGLSHQAAFLSDKTPRPALRNPAAEAVFNYYAPVEKAVGVHFHTYDTFIHTPLIRSAVRNLDPADEGHITVYLPAYDDRWLLGFFHAIPGIRWQIFSKSCRAGYSAGNVDVMPVSGTDYLHSLETCHGCILGAGFEAPAEGLYLGKKMMVIPMKNQYEQKCNAVALKQLGITVENTIGRDFPVRLRNWLEHSEPRKINFPDNKTEIVERVLELAETSSETGPSIFAEPASRAHLKPDRLKTI
ncbi:MAG: glycosyl transferase [Balneolaceae bacterium]|nr:MAG: glycosyl transferase [Balneolaceae bacterium]